MIDHEEYMRVEEKGGKVFIVYTDIDRLEQHMKELAPEDKDVTEEFINYSARPTFPRIGCSGGDVRCSYPYYLGALHWQLEGEL